MSNGLKQIDQASLILALKDWAKNRNVSFKEKVKYGLTLWGTQQTYDVVLGYQSKHVALKYTTQLKSGSAFQSAAADILTAMRIEGLKVLAVLAGDGIPDTFKVWAATTGFAVREEDLTEYLTYHFGINNETTT